MMAPFPDGFVWGVATSAFQVEGALDKDGRGPSIWDRFCRVPGAIANGDIADVTADHYHRWLEDVEIMAGLGVRAYRFSIAWPRIQPTGRSPVNAKGMAWYDRLVDALLERDIAPCPTLYHWDLPAAFDDAGGWLDRSTAERFGEYSRLCFDALGDRVGTWFTINEPWVAATLGYRLGIHAPGRRDLAAAVRASHELLRAHAAAVEAFRASGAGARGRIGPVLNLMPTYPATDSDADREAAVGSDGYTNRWFLDPILRGAYPADTFELLERLAGPFDWLEPEDLARIGRPVDLVGVNYYARRVVTAGRTEDGLPWRVVPATPGIPTTDTGWEITPECLTDLLVRVRTDYGDVPLLVTENGCVFLDAPDPAGRIADAGRVRFLRDHLAAIRAAIDAGVRVEGYFAWSLLDNFEWAEGLRSRFGLVHVDYPSGRRLVKDSGHAYARIIAANGIDQADVAPRADAVGRPVIAVGGE
ncbi:MAG TPA: GH1 family beta-glucosidase [Candidatus Limnocylindrales bacterium]|nr:GH1 family beta-glucosidase [Candidatus Limnocylindrales bacterium]